MEPTKQQEIIIAYKGNAVIIAAPGSGKTFVLSEKIKQILTELKDHEGIAAISYTNKASNELRERSLKNGVNPKSSFFGTIDKFFISEIVIPFGKQMFGHPHQDFSIVALNTLSEEQQKDFNWFTRSMTPNALTSEHMEILKSYFLKGILPIDAVGVLANYIFTASKACKKYFKARYRYIFIDEYQDSGINQHEILLQACALNIFGVAVGDLNQSIYAFSGKDAKYLSDLTQSTLFRLFKLDKNHRCHPSIINYSNYLLNPKTALIPVDSIVVFYHKVDGNEIAIAAWIDKNLASIKTKFSIDNNKLIAVLTRGNRTAEIINKNLKTPSKISITTSLDLSLNIWSGIFSNLLNFIYNSSYKFIEVVEGFTTYDKLSKADRKKIIELKSKVTDIFSLKEFDKTLALSTFQNIAEIIAPNSFNAESVDLLDEVLSSPGQLYSYQPPKAEEIGIMTLHKSKGLEFDLVIHLDLCEWILPYGAKGSQKKDLPLEWIQDINLHYVGVTRAKKGCILLVSTLRTNNQGEIKNVVDSEFLWENEIEKLRYVKAKK